MTEAATCCLLCVCMRQHCCATLLSARHIDVWIKLTLSLQNICLFLSWVLNNRHKSNKSQQQTLYWLYSTIPAKELSNLCLLAVHKSINTARRYGGIQQAYSMCIISYRDIEYRGIFLIVVYRASLYRSTCFSDVIIIITWVTAASGGSVKPVDHRKSMEIIDYHRIYHQSASLRDVGRILRWFTTETAPLGCFAFQCKWLPLSRNFAYVSK